MNFISPLWCWLTIFWGKSLNISIFCNVASLFEGNAREKLVGIKIESVSKYYQHHNHQLMILTVYGK